MWVYVHSLSFRWGAAAPQTPRSLRARVCGFSVKIILCHRHASGSRGSSIVLRTGFDDSYLAIEIT